MAGDAHRVEVQPLRSTDPPALGRHRVVGRLGGGGMGVVYLAEGPIGQVAIKLIRSEYADDPQFRARFHREVQACFRVGGLHTARLVDFELDADRPWLATEFVDAPDLAAHVAAYGPLSVPDQLDLAAGLAEALASIHAVGLIHRDLKPTNVLWTPGGPKVIDFGIAAATEARPLTVVGGVVGTPGWLSPEQAAGGEVTAASDVFGWAAMVVFASTGQPPFGSGRTESAALRDPSVELRVDESRLAPELPALVRWALDRDPARRPAAAQLGERLAGHVWGTPVPPTRILGDAARTPNPPGRVGTGGGSVPGGLSGGGTPAGGSAGGSAGSGGGPGSYGSYGSSGGGGGVAAGGSGPGGGGAPAGTEDAASERRGPRRRRRRLLTAGAIVLVLAVAGVAAAVLLTRGSSPGGSSGFTATAPWRITFEDKIEGPNDTGCKITVTNTVTGEHRTTEDIYSRRTFQVSEAGTFRWTTNNPGCLVSAQTGSGTARLPFAQQSSSGDTDAFAPGAGLVSVTVLDFSGSDDCSLSLHDVADGRELAFATATPDGGPVLLDPGGRAQVYLADLTCGVRVSAAPR